jgi:hypothetical protein
MAKDYVLIRLVDFDFSLTKKIHFLNFAPPPSFAMHTCNPSDLKQLCGSLTD